MKLFIADAGRDYSVIHCVDVAKGEYLLPKRTKGNFNDQANQLLQLVLKHRPEKLVFDEHGIGLGLKNRFELLLKECNLDVTLDGTVLYSL